VRRCRCALSDKHPSTGQPKRTLNNNYARQTPRHARQTHSCRTPMWRHANHENQKNKKDFLSVASHALFSFFYRATGRPSETPLRSAMDEVGSWRPTRPRPDMSDFLQTESRTNS
jgi:hypothetical protein